MSQRTERDSQGQNPSAHVVTQTAAVGGNAKAVKRPSGAAAGDTSPVPGKLRRKRPGATAGESPARPLRRKKRRVRLGPDGQPIKVKKKRPEVPAGAAAPASDVPVADGERPRRLKKRPPGAPGADRPLKRKKRPRPEGAAAVATGAVVTAANGTATVPTASATPAAPASPQHRPNKQPPAAPAAAVAPPASAASHLLEEPAPHSEKVVALGAISTSLIVHAAVLVVLGLIMLPFAASPDPPELEALQDRSQEELTELLEYRLTPSESASLVSAHSTLKTGHHSAIDAATEPTFDQELSESSDAPTVNVGPMMHLAGVRGSDFAVDNPEETKGDPHAIVDGYDEAMDRITQEILGMLRKGKVLVVWVFDQSESMKDDQQEIAARIEKVYQELGLHGVNESDVLLTAVTSYGSGFKIHTPRATSNIDLIRQAIHTVPTDPTGKEMMCDAVGATIQQFKSIAQNGRRQMAMILVTDESGDQETNVTKLEAALYEAKQARCRIYVLGREAVFGYPYAHMFWRHPQTGRIHLLPIDRGPETPFAEQLQTNGFHRRTDAHPSGFGPYEQCRLARETGGIFFMLPTVEADLVHEGQNMLVEQYRRKEITKEEYLAKVGEYRRYSLQALRPYLPSLESRHDYMLERNNSKLRATVWKVISDLNPYDPQKAEVIELRTTSFSPNPRTFATQVQQEIAKAQLYVTYLHAAEQAMENLADARRKEIYPRWQANYDLIYAQILAYKVRIYEYMAYLQHFMKEPKVIPLRKEDPKKIGWYQLARWHIDYRTKTITGEQTASYIERSREMFKKVIEQHPGTPWAARAELELARGFGVELMPDYDYHDPRPRKPGKPKPKIPIPKL